MPSYSHKPLLEKLGYTSGSTIFTHDCPKWLLEELAQARIISVSTLPAAYAHWFVTDRDTLQRLLNSYSLADIEKFLWLSWPKKASKIPTNITEQTLRDMVLPLDWVDIKVAAVDDVWSGLKFTRRKQK